jgi:hypothetical protein
MTKEQKGTLIACGIACILGAIVWYYVIEKSWQTVGSATSSSSTPVEPNAAKQAPPKEYVVCPPDEDKNNPTDCVPYDDYPSEGPPQPSGL